MEMELDVYEIKVLFWRCCVVTKQEINVLKFSLIFV